MEGKIKKDIISAHAIGGITTKRVQPRLEIVATGGEWSLGLMLSGLDADVDVTRHWVPFIGVA